MRGPGWPWRFPVLPLLVPVVVFAEALFGDLVLAPGDGLGLNLPWHAIAARAWRAGQLPVWNPYEFAGYPLLASLQPGVLYPANWLAVLLPPTVAYNLAVVSHFMVAGVGAWLLARRLTGDPLGATVAGLAFSLSGFMFAHLGHVNIVAAAAWLPWVLYAYDLLLERLTPPRLLLGAASLAMCLFAGHPQLFFCVLGALGLYALLLAGLGRGRGEVPAGRAKVLARAALMAGSGLALGAVQLFPTAAFSNLTPRAEFPYEEAVSFSLPLSHGALLLFPYLFGNQVTSGPFEGPYGGLWNLTELTAYPGLAALVLAAAGLCALRRDRRVLALCGVAAILGVVALGPVTPLGRLVHRLPVYGQFRAWARYLVVLDLAVAILAAYGVAALRRPGAGRAAARRATVAGAMVVLAAVAVPRLGRFTRHAGPEGVDPLAVAVPALAAVTAAVLALALAGAARAGGRRWSLPAGLAGGLLVLVVAADPVLSFGAFYEWRSVGPRADDVEAQVRGDPTVWGGVSDRPGGLDRFLFVGPDTTAMEDNYVARTALGGRSSANGSNALAPGDYLEAVGDMGYNGAVGSPDRIWGPGSWVLDLLRVTTVLAQHDIVPPDGSPLRDGRQVRDRLVRYEHRPILDDAFLVGRVEVRPREAILEAVSGRAPFDPTSVGLVERPCSCLAQGGAGPAGAVGHRRFGFGRTVVDLETARPAMLVVSQAWSPGWRASVDGRPAPVVRVDGLLQGVPVGRGRQRVVLSYQAPGLRAGIVLSFAWLFGVAGWATRARRGRRRTPSSAGRPRGQGS